MQIQFWGVRGDIALTGTGSLRYGGHTLCTTVIGRDGQLCILDAGSGLSVLGQNWHRFRSQVSSKRALFLISHSHWSHTQGIGFFHPFFERGNFFAFYGAAQNEIDFRDILEAQLATALSPLQTLNHLLADLSFWQPESCIFDWGRTEVNCFDLATDVPSYQPLAYRLTDGEHALVYIPTVEYDSDTIPAEVVGLCRGASLLIHEAYFTGVDYEPGWGHCRAEQAVQLAIEAKVSQLALFHYNPTYDDDRIDLMVQECRQLARSMTDRPPAIIGAREGLTLTI